MGFFDKILQGLGFADENDIEEIKSVTKMKEEKQVVGEYNLQDMQTAQDLVEEAEEQLEEVQKQEDQKQEKAEEEQKKRKIKKQTLTFAPQTQKEVESVLENLKDGHNIIIKLSAFNESDIFRAMDFVAGYCYCLNVKIKKINNDTFLLELK